MRLPLISSRRRVCVRQLSRSRIALPSSPDRCRPSIGSFGHVLNDHEAAPLTASPYAVDKADKLGGLYSTAFLLEREARLTGAVEAWRAIIHWNEARGHTLQTAWPKQEVERLLAG